MGSLEWSSVSSQVLNVYKERKNLVRCLDLHSKVVLYYVAYSLGGLARNSTFIVRYALGFR